MKSKNKLVTILLPCLNEEIVLDKCIKTIKNDLKNLKYPYEILLCDNGSTDNSIKIAKKNKIKVVEEPIKGYGSTLINGINNAKGDYLVMLDCDLTYDSRDIPKMIDYLDEGYDFVIGNRFKGKETSKEAFSFSHKHGAKALNTLANILFRTHVKDFHCGLRAFTKKSITKINLTSTGMEFASEMVIKAKINNLRIKQFDTNYYKSIDERKSKLRTIPDGFRHLSEIIKLKYNTSNSFKYISTFIITILLLQLLLILVTFIPQKQVSKNIIKSMQYYKDNGKVGFLDHDRPQTTPYIIDYAADSISLNMVYLIDSSNSISNIIRMDYYKELEGITDDFVKIFKNKNGKLVNYSRYWQGQTVYIRILSFFMPIQYMYIFNLIILGILFLILLIKCFRESHLLAVLLALTFIMVNAYIPALCFNYFFSFLSAITFSIITLDFYKKGKNIDIIMLISGICTCFFDFLTCETLAVTIPLFIYSYLKYKNNEDISIKELIKLIFIWGISYSLTFATKWLINCLYFGPDFIFEIYKKASIRVYKKNTNIFLMFFAVLYKNFKCLFPFSFFKNGILVILGIFLVSIYLFIYNIEDKKRFIPFIILAGIPLIRYFVLSAHSAQHFMFTYRALIPLILLIMLIYITAFKSIKKSK